MSSRWATTSMPSASPRAADGIDEVAHLDRKSTRLNSSHTEIYTLSLHDALPILKPGDVVGVNVFKVGDYVDAVGVTKGRRRHRRSRPPRSEEHTSELQSHRDLHSFPTRRSSDLETR